MFKKLFVVAAVVVAGLFIMNKTNLGSYASTAWKKVRAGASNSVPLEFELERVKNEISKLQPDMKEHITAIAQESVVVENLRDDVKTCRANLDRQKDKIMTVRAALEEGKTTKVIYIHGKEFPTHKVKEALARDFESYKHGEEGLHQKEKLLEAKEAALGTAREQLSSMKQVKEELEVQVASLEAELKNVRLAQTRSTIQLDDSRLARIKQSIHDIRDRLKVERKVGDMATEFQDELGVQVEKKMKAAEVIKDIDSYFGSSKEEKTAAK